MKFEGVPLMRTGESLRNMSDEETFAILSEQENDFSAQICPDLKIDDLDKNAIAVLKQKYSEKQNNEAFANQDDEQALKDLDLLSNNRFTYAALILLGKTEKLKEFLPQCTVNLEFRTNPAEISFEHRNIFTDSYFLLIDDLWKIIDARNKNKHIQLGSYISDIPELNDEVVRESINNAVAHRDYTKTSEIVIKQSSEEFSIHSHGGFPLGVTAQNILTINSTPRNRLLADVLTKTGLVEQSGQGVDKIFYRNISDGKGFPSYADSDSFQVTLRIPLAILYPAFAIFVREIQKSLPANQKLGVHHIIALAKIRDKADIAGIDSIVIARLLEVKAIRKDKEDYLLSALYTEITQEVEGSDWEKILYFVNESENPVKMRDIIALFGGRLTRRQVNNMVFNLVKTGELLKEGEGSATVYSTK